MQEGYIEKYSSFPLARINERLQQATMDKKFIVSVKTQKGSRAARKQKSWQRI